MSRGATGIAMSLITLLGAMAVATPSASAEPGCAAGGVERQLDFASGALWRFCAGVDVALGLELSELRYRAPGDIERSVLTALHPAALLVQPLGSDRASAVFASSDRAVLAPANCPGTIEALVRTGSREARSVTPSRDAGSDANAVTVPACLWPRATGLLSKYGDLGGVQGGEWRLSVEERIDGRRWRYTVALGEAGRIAADIAALGTDGMSESAEQGEMLVAWRLAFALDTPAADSVEEFDFTLREDLGSRRVMGVTPLGVEALRTVAHERFRGWRVRDASGAGYYLDSQKAGAGWSGAGGNWTRFDLALSAASDCERSAAPLPTRGADTRCAGTNPASLDRWVNGESLDARPPVLWTIGSAALFDGDGAVGVELLPFDWTTRSPFPPSEDGS